tara:strand:- start:419 stop:637 length:219 start_codon:yes stop_codon:yes gene_type:complete
MKKKFNTKELDRIFEENWTDLTEKTKLEQLANWDSLKQIELIVLLEKKMKKKLSIKEIINIKTVKDVNKILK